MERKSKLLYGVMPEEHLSNLFDSTTSAVEAYESATNWLTRMRTGQDIRTATHTTKRFICSDKGATSRCETSMTMIKSAGTTKAEMRNYSLPELQHRHREVVENYETRAKDGIRKAIKAGQILSPYVLDKEEEEFKHVPDLEIVSTTANVANPFHGILQSSKKTFSICLTRPEEVESLGVSLKFARVEDRCGLEVEKIEKGSLFVGTDLVTGMLIHTVNDSTFTSLEEGIDLLKSVKGQFTIWADVPPTIGTVYEVRRKTDKKGVRLVFIPDAIDSNGNIHCQSTYHKHTAFWMRCRYIQRALMEHPTRSMKEISTIHTRWHINTSPLYSIVHHDLVNLMEIPGLGCEALPAFLKTAGENAAHAATADCNAEGPNEGGAVQKEAFFVPSSKTKRYNAAEVQAKKIVEMCKEDPKVFEMAMPMLKQLYQNCLLVRGSGSKSSAVQSANDAVAVSKAQLPVMPDSIRRSVADDVNHANVSYGKEKKSSKRRKKGCS